MNRKLWAVLALVTIVAMVAVACGPKPTEAPAPTEAPPTEAPPPTEVPEVKFRVGMVSDVGGIDDASFNENTWKGLQDAQEQLGVESTFLESQAQADYENNITEFAEQGYDMIITVGFLLGDATYKMAAQYPDIKFAIVDYPTGGEETPNLQGILFNVHEASFPVGYVAAAMADQLDPAEPQVAYIGGMQIPPVEEFIVAYEAGVKYYNEKYGKNVKFTGVYVGDFEAPDQGKLQANSLIDEGADIIMGVGGKTGNGGIAAAKERGKWGVGVDVDQYYTLPNEKDILVTSTVKRLDKAVFGVINAALEDQFGGGTNYIATLENEGVGVAPFHDFEDKVPAEIKADLEQIQKDVIAKKLWTGWGEPPTAEAVPAEKPKVAFVYVAPIGDMGWTWAHEQGRLMLEEELGVETAYIENVPEGPDAERVIRDFAQKGYDLVFATSFGFMDPMVTVASEFPDKYFEHCSGYKTADNMATYFGRIYQPRFLSGLVAGKATQANKIGYVAAFPIPEVLRGINAFTLGVREANPEATVNVVWTNTWFDPVLEKEAAEALLDQGCDVIAQHQDTTEPQKAAQERGMVSIGYDSDMSQFVGDTVLTSPIWNWGPYYVERTKAVMDGTWETHQYWGGMKDGIVDLAPLSDRVPDDVKALVEEWKQKILSGEWDVFAGPIKGQNGELSVPAGVSMTDEEMLSMDWFVEGVVGEAPGEPPVAEAVAVEKPKVAFVYVGPVGDMGWTYAHDQGRLYLEEELGVETAYSELVAEGPDSTRVIRDYAEKGYDVIFATSFGYMDSVIEVAAEYPDTTFEHCTGYKTADNAGIYDGRGYQGWYLAGIVAGKMTKNNVLGYIAPYPIPEVVRNMNAFALGALSVNPDAEVHMVWLNAWVDPPKEREAAQALADLGADVIARESDSTEPDKLAQELGLYSIGYNAYVPDAAPDALLTAPVWNWGIYYKKAVEDVMNGTWTNTPVWWGLKEGLLELAPIADFVPDDVKTLVEERQTEIVAGEFDVFAGPLKDNTGELRVPEGETMTDEEKLAFDWLVEGVVGTIPK